MVQIQAYTIGELRQRLTAGEWFEGDPIPLTRERALSQVNNPRAEDADVALLVATDDGKVIAHLGIVPDCVFMGDRQLKIGWLTAWWANPDRKYAGTGMMLMMRAMGFYKNGVGASGFSEDAKAVYAATKRFKTIKELSGLTAFARCDFTTLLARRSNIAAKLKPLLRVVDAAGNGLVRLRHWSWQRANPLPETVQLEYGPEFDAEANRFLEQHPQNTLSRRGAKELNWIARYTWMTCAPLNPPPPFRFDTTAQTHRSYHLKVRAANGQLAAVLLLHIIDDHLIIPCVCHDQQAELVARIIGQHVVTLRLNRVTLFRSDLIEQLERLRFPWVVKKVRTRPWVLSGPAAEVAGTAVAVQDGDGDCAFTL